jgi:hypothetical protein
VRRVLETSTRPEAQLGELINLGRDEAVGPTRAFLDYVDRHVYRVIGARRAAQHAAGSDILSILLQAETEDGERLTDKELRDELLTLVLAGHETTANQLAWTFERLLRTPAAYDRLRDAVRAAGRGRRVDRGDDPRGMRNRPVIPIIGRRVTEPWRLGEHVLPAESWVLMSICSSTTATTSTPTRSPSGPSGSTARSRDLQLDPVRRGHPPLPGGHAGHGRAAFGAAGDRRAHRPRGPRPRARARTPPHVTMIPEKGGRVIVTSKRPG